MKLRGRELVVRALEDEGARSPSASRARTTSSCTTPSQRRSGDGRPRHRRAERGVHGRRRVARLRRRSACVNVVPGAGRHARLSGIAEALHRRHPAASCSACGIRTRHRPRLPAARHRPARAAAAGDEGRACGRTRRRSIYADRAPRVRISRARARRGRSLVEIPAELLPAHATTCGRSPAAPPPTRAGRARRRGDLERARRDSSTARGASCSTSGYGARGAAHELRRTRRAARARRSRRRSRARACSPSRTRSVLWNGFGAYRAAVRARRRGRVRRDARHRLPVRRGRRPGSYGFTPPRDAHPRRHQPRGVRPQLPRRRSPSQADAAAFARPRCSPLARRPRPAGRARASRSPTGHRAVREEWRARAERGAGHAGGAASTRCSAARPGRDLHRPTAATGRSSPWSTCGSTRPGRFLAPVDYSCMGYAVPAAIGAKLANPGRDVVALAGDGALLMTGLELLTAAAYGAGVVVCRAARRRAGADRPVPAHRARREAVNSTVAAVRRRGPSPQTIGAAYVPCPRDADVDRALVARPSPSRASGRPVIVDVAIDYSRKTYFTRGVVTTNFWRLPVGGPPAPARPRRLAAHREAPRLAGAGHASVSPASELTAAGRVANRSARRTNAPPGCCRRHAGPQTPHVDFGSSVRLSCTRGRLARMVRHTLRRRACARASESRIPSPESRTPNVMLPRCTSPTGF